MVDQLSIQAKQNLKSTKFTQQIYTRQQTKINTSPRKARTRRSKNAIYLNSVSVRDPTQKRQLCNNVILGSPL